MYLIKTIGIILILFIALNGCSTVGEVMPVGVENYTVSSEKGGQFWTLGPSWSDVKALSINRANEYCSAKNKKMSIVGWETHGVRGFSPLNAELTFKCV